VKLFINKFTTNLKKPWSNREFLRFLIYVAQREGVKLRLDRQFKINKIVTSLSIGKGYPKTATPVVFHRGLFDPTVDKYLRLEIEEGYVILENGCLKLTSKGERYVKTMLIPNTDSDIYEEVAKLLMMPEDFLEKKAYREAGFKVEMLRGKQIWRFIELEDFEELNLKKAKIKIFLNTLLQKIQEVRNLVEHTDVLDKFPKIDVENLSSRKKVKKDLRKVLIKTRVPASKAMQIVELKNAVLNRFVYVVAIYLINVIEGRYAGFKEIYWLTHDWAFEVEQKRRSKKYRRYASEKEKEDIRKRQLQTASSRVVRNDLNLLVEMGILHKDSRTNSYAVTALSYTDGKTRIKLPPSDVIREYYELLHDELAVINSEYRARKRGFNGGVRVSELRYTCDINLSKVIVVDCCEKELQLTKLRSQGLLMDREEACQILYRTYRAIFQVIKEFYDIKPRDEGKLQIILVLRDAIVAYVPAIEEFKESPIGLIGHIRKVNDSGVSDVEVCFERYEPPSNFEYIIVVDPIIATGSTLLKVIKHLRAKCSRGKEPRFIVASVLVCRIGAKAIASEVDSIFCVSLEDELLKGAWLKPGLRGVKDLGDLVFKTNLDWSSSEGNQE